ncbi:Flagella accessory C family protein [Natrialba hulunbeirensis JCM 10989]|uniref:Flagella accessory C family protein n=1 Tax=Natrialba hulunbeirensis JCM 10989 TaxID=1227493 RepID=L9ZVR8_9EURY|nr:FlaD/FlaE family flagellar protein [Natrialba hulunbeirensis]ELY90424.1 Flagella accessory C family protein [Natrialba hulunbeirensis JCM 10989]
MVLSIIGNILGDGDDDGASGRSSSGNDSDDIIGGDLAGSMSDDELLPGARTESAAGGNGGDGTGNDDLFDDGDLGGDLDGDLDGGGDDFLDDDSMSIDGMGDMSEMDDMGSMDDMDRMDGMDAMNDGGAVSSEVEARVEEMENSVGSLSSTVNTVQSENEKISESLDDIEENIRKLLEVYEMVTQGVNPFVEGDTLTDSMAGGGAAGSGDFGGQSLFDSNDGDEEDEAIDEDIANAEADDFLDESIIDDDEGFDDDDEFDDLEDDMSMDADADSDLDDADSGGDDDLSFDELKSEYDSGDADWDADADGDGNAKAEGDIDETADQSATEGTDPLEDDLGDESFADDLAVDGESTDDAASLIDDADADGDADAGTDTNADPLTTGDSTEHATDSLEHPVWDDGGRPYLETIPSEYDTEFVVMDWLEYLVSELGLNGAARTLCFYESIHWVSGSVESHLQTVLNGFGGGPDIGDPEPHSSLGVDHKRSLWWISQIATPEKKRRAFDVWVEEEGITVAQAMAAAEQHQPEAETAGTDESSTSSTSSESDTAPPVDDVSATTETNDPAAGASGAELTFDESTATDSDHESVSESVAVTNAGEHADGALDTHDTHDSPEETLKDETTVDDSADADDIELEFTTDEPLDPFAAEGDEDGSADQIDGDSEGDSISGADDDGTAATTATAADTELESSGAQKIFIEEAEADTTDSDHRNEPAGERVEPEAEVTDGGQMIWVDSDVVLSESGARLCNTRATTGGVDREARTEIAKPLVVSDEPADLEGWQVERIKLLLAPEEFDVGRERGTDREEAADEREQAREPEQEQ